MKLESPSKKRGFFILQVAEKRQRSLTLFLSIRYHVLNEKVSLSLEARRPEVLLFFV